jgi:hypothetical protein
MLLPRAVVDEAVVAAAGAADEDRAAAVVRERVAAGADRIRFISLHLRSWRKSTRSAINRESRSRV